MIQSRKAVTFMVLVLLLCVTSVITESEELFDNFSHVRSNTSAITQKNAVMELISRILPKHAHLITVEIDFSLEGNTYILDKKPSTPFLFIIASDGISACKGLHYYIKYILGGHISWSGNRLDDLPQILPSIQKNSTSRSRFIYHQNVCTWSYSFAWWTWSQWRQHIDWMALMGISLTIAPIQEAIWTTIYKDFGLNDTEINDHFAGPAFQAWQRMGNIRGWGGPLSNNYKRQQIILQKQIIKAQRDIGMTVAIPSFAGHVPVAFKRLYPNASMTPVDSWNHFQEKYCCSLYVDPNDPLFHMIGIKFLMEAINEYGTDHIYFSDPFNEIQPKTSDPVYLLGVARNIYDIMKTLDLNAVWLLQGWMFVKNPFWNNTLIRSFLTAVPRGKMLILDLQSEQFPQYTRTRSYYGQPFIWCMLHNFGGTLGMHGSVDIVNQRIENAWRIENSTMIGVGITPEGINQNYAIYEFALERAWQEEPFNTSYWFMQYANTRYGNHNKNGLLWSYLLSTVYAYRGLIKLHGKYTICRRPSTKLKPWTWYNVTKFSEAWEIMINMSASTYNNNVLLQHDLVDVTRQFLQNLFDQIYLNLIDAYRHNNNTVVMNLGAVMQEVILDMDRVLRTNSQFLLGKWLQDARNLALTERESIVFEVNARNQITTWGPNGEIVDYSTKQWSGLVEDYFFKRWTLFFAELESSLENNSTFDEKKFQKTVLKSIENPFNTNRKIYPIHPNGATYLTAKDIYQKWYNYDIDNQLKIKVPLRHRHQRARKT